MTAFTKPLRIEQDADDPKFWTTLEAFEYHVGRLESGEIIYVPAGFRTDFQSIPRAVWSLFGHPMDEDAACGLGHDWLYQHPDDGLGEARKRRRCDQLYLEMLVVKKCPWWKRSGKYFGTRAGGWVGWNRYRKAERDRN